MQVTMAHRDLKLRITCTYLPVVSHVLARAGLPLIRSIELLADEDSNAPRDPLEIRLPQGDAWETVPLANSGPGTALSLTLAANGGYADWLYHVSRPVSSRLEIWLRTHCLAELPLVLLPTWHWPHVRAARPCVAAYALPGDSWIGRTISSSVGRQAESNLASDFPSYVRQAPERAAGVALKAVYAHLVRQHRIHYEHPRLRTDESGEISYQAVRTPMEVLAPNRTTGGRANCLDLALIMAGCLESVGLRPLILFSGPPDEAPDHAFVGCWRDRAPRYHPLLQDPEALAAFVTQGDLLVVESTGVCVDHKRMSFDQARDCAQAIVTDPRASLHAVDVEACRPPRGAVAPLELAHEPVVMRAYWEARQMATTRGSRRLESAHLLYGLCRAAGETCSWLLKTCGSSPQAVVRTIEQAIPCAEPSPDLRATKNYEACVRAAQANAAAEGRSTVHEADLLWAVLECRSKNVQGILGAAGANSITLTRVLDTRYRRPENLTESHSVYWNHRSLPEGTNDRAEP